MSDITASCGRQAGNYLDTISIIGNQEIAGVANTIQMRRALSTLIVPDRDCFK